MNNTTKSFLIGTTLLLILCLFIWGLGDALFPLMFSFAAAYLIFPLVQKLELKGIHRNHAVLGIFVLFFMTVVISMVLVLPGLIADANNLIQDLPEGASRAIERIEDTAANLGYDLNLSRDEIQSYIFEHTSQLSGGLLKSFSKGLFMAFSGVTRWLLSILNLFLIPLFFFHVINDFERLTKEIKAFVPKSIQPQLFHYFSLSDRVLSGYIRGQIMVALVLGCLYGIGLSIIGLRFGILIGFISGLLSIIPLAGFVMGFATAILIGLANHAGAGLIMGIVVVYVVVQALESTIITPKLVGNKVGLSALATMLALIVGGNLLGLPGMLIAIPAAAILKAVFADLRRINL